MLHRLFAFVLLSIAVQAAPLSAERAATLRERFETRQRETRTWACAFTQTQSMAGMRQPIVSTGTLSYRAPELLRLEFAQPAGEFTLVVGDQLFIQKVGKKVAVKSLTGDISGKPYLSLLGLLRGKPAEDEKFFTPEITREDDHYTIVLTRKADASSRLPKRITNTIDAESLEVREVLVELPGGTLSYRFSEPARNRPMDAARFAVPSGN